MSDKPKVNYGTIEPTEIIDDEGSTKTIINNIRAGVPQKPRKIRYEIRHRTDKTNIQQISEIAQRLMDDITKLDTLIKLERTKHGEMNGYYHLVECYTVVEY